MSNECKDEGKAAEEQQQFNHLEVDEEEEDGFFKWVLILENDDFFWRGMKTGEWYVTGDEIEDYAKLTFRGEYEELVALLDL